MNQSDLDQMKLRVLARQQAYAIASSLVNTMLETGELDHNPKILATAFADLSDALTEEIVKDGQEELQTQTTFSSQD